MNWNNGNGLNSGTISDKIFNETISFGSNQSPEFQGAYAGEYEFGNSPKSTTVAHPVLNWAANVRRPGFSQPFSWHLEWEKENTIKDYWFTVRNMDRARKPGSTPCGSGDIHRCPANHVDVCFTWIDIIYHVNFPNPGGNNSSPAGRIRNGTDWFQRNFEPDEPSKLFVWDGDYIKMTMNVVGQILLRPDGWVPDDGRLHISKALYGLHGDNIDDNTVFSAIIRTDSNRYMTFTKMSGTNQYHYTGSDSLRTRASVLTFSVNNPAEITDIPNGMTIAVEEIFQNSTLNPVNVEYALTCHGGGGCLEHSDENGLLTVAYTDSDIHSVTVTNDYYQGVGFVEVHMLLDGFANDWGVNDSTVFHVMIWDVDNENYLLFKNAPGPDGTYWCVGNTEKGLSEPYLGTSITAVPISVDNPIKLSNLLTQSRYEVREVVWDDSIGVDGDWKIVREKCESSCTAEDCDWKTQDDWMWGVTYSENNGVKKLEINETQVITVTNRYKHATGKITVFKELAGYPLVWGVGNNTLFHIKVSDDNQIVFDKNPKPDGSYRAIGHINCGDPSCIPFDKQTVGSFGEIHFSEQPASGNWNDIYTEIPFSVNNPALLSNLWTDSALWEGDRHYYKIEEVGGEEHNATYSLNYTAPIDVPLTGIEIPVYADCGDVNCTVHSTIVTVTNRFEHRSGNLAVIQEFDPAGYHGEWGIDDDTEFDAIVLTDDGQYLVFEEVSPYRYMYTGTTNRREDASRLKYSVNNPTVIMDIPDTFLVSVEQLIDPDAPYAGYVSTYYDGNDCGVELDGSLEVTVTNMFRLGGIDFRVSKQLAGYYDDWDIDADTVFYAVINDVTAGTQLIFTREPDGRFRSVGHLECGSGCYYCRTLSDGLTEVPFSVIQPAELTHLRPGRVYTVEELSVENSTENYTYINGSGNFIDATVINTFDSIIYKVIYNANWPLDVPREGEVPPTVEHRAQEEVVAFGNPGNVQVTDWAKLGWALEPTSREPVFWKGSNGNPNGSSSVSGSRDMTISSVDSSIVILDNSTFIMPARDVDLYGVWRPRPLVKNVVKEASRRNFSPGDTIDYDISFLLPPEVNFYESVRISDVYRAEDMTFDGIASLTIGGVQVTIPPELTVQDGQVDVVIHSGHFTDKGGEEVKLTLNFTANEDARGVIRNTAKVFVKTVYEDEPDVSDGADAEIVVEYGMVGIIYNPNWPDGKRGSGSPPVDDNIYDPNNPEDMVTIRGNEGGLNKSGYKFLGWSTDPNARVPEFSPGDKIPMDGHRILYGVWVLDVNLQKTPSSDVYSTGDVIDYTISFTVPTYMGGYESIRIEDVIPDGLEYTGRYELGLDIGEYDASVDITVGARTVNGSYTRFVVIEKDLLSFCEGREISLTFGFVVTDDAIGEIVNTANLYFTPVGEDEPTIPDSSTTAVITPLDEVEFPIIPGNFIKNVLLGENNIVLYTISFTLPNTITDYEGLLIYDELPDTLNYISGELNTSGTITADSGKISAYIDKSELNAGQTVELVITAAVNSNWISGDITNTARLYIQRVPGVPPNPETDEPDSFGSVPVTPQASSPVAVKPDDFIKNAVLNDDTVVYTIGFTLPTLTAGYEGVLIYDEMPDTLDYINGELNIDGVLTEDSGKVSAYIDKSAIEANAGSAVTLTITAAVNSNWIDGDITNTARLYIQRIPGVTPNPETDEPDDSADVPITPQQIVELPIIPSDFRKNATSAGEFIETGDTIIYTISFTVPSNTQGYEGVLIYDEFPDTLDYVSSRLNVNGVITEDSGKVSAYIGKSVLQANAGQVVEFTITAAVSPYWTGESISNTAQLFIQRTRRNAGPRNRHPRQGNQRGG
jgi:fimbrial isopeptide formation D2 family protein